MNIIKKILNALGIFLLVAVFSFVALIVYALISDYKPEEKIVLSTEEKAEVLSDTIAFSLITWNIGYCGLDKDMDFFYDGGTKVITTEENCAKNLSAVLKLLKSNDSIDFIILQEVDRKSKRSYNHDEYISIADNIKTHSGYFAPNYDVFFVPVPPSEPMGKVFSGVSIFSKYIPSLSVRYSFPGQYGFPKQLFMLDRCFMVNRYPMANGKELIIINTHNEAFDPGNIRLEQMNYLKNFILSEYQNGNYVIAGGDWNQCPPGFKAEFTVNQVNKDQMVISSEYLPADWTWAYDSHTPSNRTVISAYDPATTTTTVIDFFLLSPNVKGVSVKCLDLAFENSDHNPVIIKVSLK